MDKFKILVIDDVSSNIDMLTNMLKETYSVITASNVKKALEFSKKENKPDLILLDIGMPEVDGYEMCRKLKESNYTKDIPVVFISSLGDSEEDKRSIEYGAADSITKPIDKNILLNKIKTQINLSQYKKLETTPIYAKIDTQYKKRKILIVDDASQNIQVALEILKNDYIISAANSGRKALDMLKDGLSPDLILLDVIMPEMDGFEVCQELKLNSEYSHIPIIFWTILENDQDMIKGLELGAVDYVTKPVEPKILQARVNTHIKLKVYQDQLLKNLKEKDEVLINQTKLATLGSMFENITHQWKQPLSLITMTSGNLRLEKEFNTLTDENLLKGLDEIDSATIHMAETIDDFRDFLKTDIQKQYFNIKEIIDKTLKLLKTKIKNRLIQIENSIADIEIYTFKNDLVQVLMNIFTNAIYALSNREEKRQINISTDILDNFIELKICDNAGGIKEENIDKIFDKYFTTKKDKIGSGLGLYMCKYACT